MAMKMYSISSGDAPHCTEVYLPCLTVKGSYRSLGLEPGLNVVTEPVNSGKSLLLEKITELFKTSQMPVEPINLRNMSFDCKLSTTNSWLQQFYKAMQHYTWKLMDLGKNWIYAPLHTQLP